MTPPEKRIEFAKSDSKKPAQTITPRAGREAVETSEDPLAKIGAQANQLPREGKNAMLQAIAEDLGNYKSRLSPEAQKKLFNEDGSANLVKIGAYYGLAPSFEKHLTPEGKVKPITEVPEETAKIPNNESKLPERDPRAKTGSQLFQEWGLNRDVNTFQGELTQKIIAEIEKGNVPDSCRNMSTVNLNGNDGIQISFRTSNGYLAVGSNNDNIQVPLSGPMAKKIADHFGWVLPTADMAAARDAQATIKLTPGGEHDISRMADLEWSRRHNKKRQDSMKEWLINYNKENTPPMTEAELSRYLTAGEKKNIFIGSVSTINNGGIGIGGLLKKSFNRQTQQWIYEPIQPYENPHPYNNTDGESGGHADYSQDTARYDSKITINERGKTPKTVALYDILRTPPPKGPPPTDPMELAKYNQAADYARYRKILNGYEGGANFNPDRSYTSHRK